MQCRFAMQMEEPDPADESQPEYHETDGDHFVKCETPPDLWDKM